MQNRALCACVFFAALPCSTAQAPGSAQGPGRNRFMAVTSTSVSQQSEFVPMTQAERWHYYFKSTFGVEGVLRSTAGAGISQLNNTPSEWGQGAEGYARRWGNSYAQHIMRETLMYGASSVFHEDNRYFPPAQSAFGQRLKYAIGSSFLARSEDGTRHLSFSRLGSYLATAFISRDWQPPGEHGPRTAIMSFGTAMGATVGFNVAREFIPKRLRRHRD
jgi:hypothetical protein